MHTVCTIHTFEYLFLLARSILQNSAQRKEMYGKFFPNVSRYTLLGMDKNHL